MEIRGLDGAITRRSHWASARSTSLVGMSARGTHDVDAANDHIVLVLHEVLLKAETTVVGDELRRDGVVADGQQRDLHAVMLCEFPRDLGLRGSLGETLAAIEVGREVAVSQAKPGVATEIGRVRP